MIIKGKKSSIGSTLTWIVATFVIIFILAIYLVFLGAIYEKKSSSSEATPINYNSLKLDNTAKLIAFLQSDTGTDNGIIDQSIYDYLTTADSKYTSKIAFFNERAPKFLANAFPGGTRDVPEYNSWLRLYYINEPEEQYPSGLSIPYTYDVANFARRSSEYCIPSESNTVVIPINPDKKIVVCWQKNPLYK